MPYVDANETGGGEMLRRFGAELRRCRLSADMSQDMLAERSGVAQSTISRIERGLAPRAAMHKIVSMAEVLGHRLPLAYCPHDHSCHWQRLDANGQPLETGATRRREAFWRLVGQHAERD